MFALESVTDDPQGEYNGKGDIQLPHWAIDGTILLAPNNKLYFVWSGIKDGELRADNMIYGEQGLYIAEMSNPWTITGEPICISLPTYEWEKNGPTGVNEGPTFLKRHDRIFAIYSASHSFTDHYCLGMLELIGEDPLDQSAWKKSENPAFSAANGVYGPGHASFTLSPDDTEDWILYHAAVQSGAAWNRDVRAQKFGWNNDGTPFFGYPVAPGNKIPVPSGEK
jgi:GH43 family beta-xylosidase